MAQLDQLCLPADLQAITATNTPTAIEMSDVEKATIVITSAGTFLNRSGVLTATVSMDGTNYVAYNMLIPNATNTNGQTLTRVSSTTAITTTAQTAIYGISDLIPFRYIKLLFTITDGATPTGNFSVGLYKQYRQSC